jgi:DnaJ-class molecular chaperone
MPPFCIVCGTDTQGKKYCPKCHAPVAVFGEVQECKQCNGKGKVQVSVACIECKGTGLKECSYCTEGSRERCGHCNGTGRKRDHCHYCKGTGLTMLNREEPCRFCGGQGKVRV